MWASHEVEQLRAEWGRTSPRLLALRLGRTYRAVLTKARSLGLRRTLLRGRRWTEEELSCLRTLWGRRDLLSIARKLNRTPHAVTEKARALRLPAPSKVEGVTIHALQDLLCTDARRINHALQVLGVTKRRVKRGAVQQKRRVTAEYVRHKDVPKIAQFLEDNPRIYYDAPDRMRTTRGVWGVGKKAESCAGCGTTKKPHCARDRCLRCYNRWLAKRRRAKTEAFPPISM
jgi:hypothetical protein